MLVHRLLSATLVLASFVLAFPFPPLDNSGGEIINPDGPGISGTSGNTATTKPRTHTHSSPSFRRGYSAYDLPVFAQRYKRSPSDIKLIGDRILVRMSVPAADCSHVKEKPHEGVVLAVGPGKKKPMDVKVGDKVLFSKYGGTEIKVEGEECLLLAERDILALG